MVEWDGLENRFPPAGGTGVRIPLSPPSSRELGTTADKSAFLIFKVFIFPYDESDSA